MVYDLKWDHFRWLLKYFLIMCQVFAGHTYTSSSKILFLLFVIIDSERYDNYYTFNGLDCTNDRSLFSKVCLLYATIIECLQLPKTSYTVLFFFGKTFLIHLGQSGKNISNPSSLFDAIDKIYHDSFRIIHCYNTKRIVLFTYCQEYSFFNLYFLEE